MIIKIHLQESHSQPHNVDLGSYSCIVSKQEHKKCEEAGSPCSRSCADREEQGVISEYFPLISFDLICEDRLTFLVGQCWVGLVPAPQSAVASSTCSPAPC